MTRKRHTPKKVHALLILFEKLFWISYFIPRMVSWRGRGLFSFNSHPDLWQSCPTKLRRLAINVSALNIRSILRLAPRETVSFISPRPPVFPEVEGKQNSLFLVRPVIKCFVISSNSKLEQRAKRIICFTPAGTQSCRSFKVNFFIMHVRVESSGCGFSREFLSFVGHRMWLRFDA